MCLSVCCVRVCIIKQFTSPWTVNCVSAHSVVQLRPANWQRSRKVRVCVCALLLSSSSVPGQGLIVTLTSKHSQHVAFGASGVWSRWICMRTFFLPSGAFWTMLPHLPVTFHYHQPHKLAVFWSMVHYSFTHSFPPFCNSIVQPDKLILYY